MIISIIILSIGVMYCIVYIMTMAFGELDHDHNQPEGRPDQDQLIALLTHRIEDGEKISEELRERVRNLERWVLEKQVLLFLQQLPSLVLPVSNSRRCRCLYF